MFETNSQSLEQVRENFMREALNLARIAASEGEVPVGCVIVSESGEIIGRGRNCRESTHSALAHAEIAAIAEACSALGDWRLTGCTIYVTLEPCPMCAGAIINARIPTLVFGAREPSSGAAGSVIDLFSERFGHNPAVYAGILETECVELLRGFFRN
jgi:tRNA(adenine34) deaminase